MANPEEKSVQTMRFVKVILYLPFYSLSPWIIFLDCLMMQRKKRIIQGYEKFMMIPNKSHISLFADDILLFTKLNKDKITNLFFILSKPLSKLLGLIKIKYNINLQSQDQLIFPRDSRDRCNMGVCY